MSRRLRAAMRVVFIPAVAVSATAGSGDGPLPVRIAGLIGVCAGALALCWL